MKKLLKFRRSLGKRHRRSQLTQTKLLEREVVPLRPAKAKAAITNLTHATMMISSRVSLQLSKLLSKLKKRVQV